MDEALLLELRGATSRRGVTRYQALAEALGAAIEAGRLAVHDRLPAERGLARALGVSRNTVVAAYDELRAQGLVRTRQGSGTVVEHGASPITNPREAWLAAALRPRTMLHALMDAPAAGIDLRDGCCADLAELPAAVWQVAPADFEEAAESAGYWPAGLPRLRRAIADHLTTDIGLATDPEQVLVTAGAQQAISLLAGATIEAGAPAVVESLTYPGAIEALTVAGARIVEVPLTAQGVELNALARAVREHRPRLVYLVASCQSPTGTVLPVHARRRLAQMAAEWDTLVVEDTTLALTQFRGDAPAPIAAFSEPGDHHLITVGSLSKVVWPGLRIGWIRAQSPRTIERLARYRTSADLGLSLPAQAIGARVVARLPELAERRRSQLRDRFEHLADLLAQHLPDWTWDEPRGGLHVWARLPVGSATELARLALDHGVEIVAGTVQSASGAAVDRVRVPFGQPPEVLAEGIERLGRAWQHYRYELARSAERPEPTLREMRSRARAVARETDRSAAVPPTAGIDVFRIPT